MYKGYGPRKTKVSERLSEDHFVQLIILKHDGKVLKKNKGQRHVFVGIEHLLRSDPAQEEWSKLHKCGYKVAADTARATREGQDVGWATSGVLVVAVANNLTSVVPTVGGRVDSVEKMMEGSLNPGSSVRRVSIFASTCGTKNGWTVRNEELMKAVSKKSGQYNEPVDNRL